jgi:hypothetical protein
MQKIVQGRKASSSRISEDPYAELNAYLNDPLEDYVDNVVRWWGVRFD